jgi:hypothetical protein
MAIPVHLQQFKAAGIYRVVFDKSTIQGVDSEILRLVVGYSEIGPFNIPVYIKSVSEFKSIYGDVSKKLEKRGIFFHRMAIQALAAGPILCLNLKKFAGETVGAATINTDFNPSFEIIDTVKVNVEDIYDTSRFWELSAEKLIGLKAIDKTSMDQYINIATTNTKESSGTFFIRKASGNKLNQYNISVSDWYSDRIEEMPEYLLPYKNSKISDFFAEIYVFKGHFTADQVLASSTLKNYFELASKDGQLLNEEGMVKGADEKPGLRLKPYMTNAYGDAVDTLDALYTEDTASPLAHYIGCLIPYFKNKKGQYVSLDVLFNADIDVHNMMMSFNTDLLDEGLGSIDLSGRFAIKTDDTLEAGQLTLHNLYAGNAVTSLLGNKDAKVVVDTPEIYNNVVKKNENNEFVAVNEFTNTARRVSGDLYVQQVTTGTYNPNTESSFDDEAAASSSIILRQVGTEDTITISGFSSAEDFCKTLKKLHAGSYEANGDTFTPVVFDNGVGTVWTSATPAFIEDGEFTPAGPQEIITSLTRIEQTSSANAYTDIDMNMNVTIVNVECSFKSVLNESINIYGSSVMFINNDGYDVSDTETIAAGQTCLVAQNIYDTSLGTILSVGDCLVAADGSQDRDEDGELDPTDNFYDNVYVQKIVQNEEGKYVIVLTGAPMEFVSGDSTYYVKIENGLNQETGLMMPKYLEGYTYINYKPEGTDMQSKLNWQNFILSALTEYKGLRTGLLNKSDIDYRYIVDTFETYVDSSVKKILSYLAKEKQSAFAILNFPAIKTFVKCPYSSYTDSKGVFNVDYIVKGFNKKKPAGKKFSLPEDSEGASFCAFYTPLKFSDGYIDTIVPAAALVSNLFMEKYISRQPYYIIAGPNYGNIRATGLVGPDYNYSQEELQIIEPYGVNCMIYRPGFGTFINANQTAKQNPVSALSKVNVRELVIYIQDEIEKVLQAYQWQFNNANTRSAIKAKADMICARVAANGGIQAYLNVMDESNNTPEIIDNEMAVLSTHIEPGMGCGKMVQELTLYRTGQMSAAISD